MQLVETLFDIPSLSITIVLGEISKTLSGLVLGDISLLHQSAAILSMAKVVICARSMYMYCPACKGSDAWKMFLSWSTL